MKPTEPAADGILSTSTSVFLETARRLALDDRMVARILHPKERIQITLNPTVTAGRTMHVDAFIVRHSDVLGPSKGGIRMAADVTIEDVSGLAMEMTWKTALIGVPFGGGKSGICCDPAPLGPGEKEAIIRSFTRGAHRHIGPELYVPAPDMGTNESDMGHIADCVSYSAGTSITHGCFVTGKPVLVGGITGRRQATGKGVVYTIAAACAQLGLDLNHLRVAVQGFGNVGAAAAAEIAGAGATVTAVSDITGGLLNPTGIDITALRRHVDESGCVTGFPGAEPVDGSAVLQADCDILIPAAGGSQLTADNAPAIKARIIAEGANAPTTTQADEIFRTRDIFVIPDILCNAGGVFVSYLEYTQETQREQMTRPQVETRLADRMTQRFHEVHAHAQQNDLPLRHAAMNLAVTRVVDGVNARGFLP